MPLLWKEILRPGRYQQSGHHFDVTLDDVRALHDTYERELAPRGLLAPLTFEHPEPSDAVPRQMSTLRKRVRDRTKYTAGWTEKTELRPVKAKDADGNEIEVEALFGGFDIPDPEQAKQFADGRHRFVSADLRPVWKDGKGNTYRHVLGGVSVCHKPIIVDQEPGFKQLSEAGEDCTGCLTAVSEVRAEPEQVGDDQPAQTPVPPAQPEPAEQPAEAPAEPAPDESGEETRQLADDGRQTEVPSNPNKPPAATDGTEGTAPNPDLPKTKDDQMEALLAHLEQAGMPLPSDTSQANLLERLLTALMGFNSRKSQQETADKSDNEPEREERPPVQFSDAQIEAAQFKLATHLDVLSQQGRIVPAQRAWVEERIEGVQQLSEDGRALDVPLQLADVLDLFARGPRLALSVVAPSDAADEEHQHPSGDEFYSQGGMVESGSETARQKSNDFAKRHGLTLRETVGA